MTLSGYVAFLALVSIVVAGETLANEEAEIKTPVRIDTSPPAMQSLFAGMRFYPGTKVTLQVDGVVIARRKVKMVTKCTGAKLFGSCLWGEKDVPETDYRNDRDVTKLPLLVAGRDKDGRALDGDWSAPAAGSSEAATAQREPLLTLKQQKQDIDFSIPASGVAALGRGFALEAYLADLYDENLPTERNVCTHYDPGECGSGEYEVRIAEIDTQKRREALKQVFTDDLVSGEQAEELIDFWIRNKLEDGKVRPDPDAIHEIVDTLITQARKQPGGSEASRSGGSRRSLLELAVRLEPNNQAARGLLVEYLADSGDYGAAQREAAANMADARRALAEAEKSPNPSAGTYLDYVRNLMAAATAAAGRGAGLVLADVQAAASFYAEATGVLKRLRANATAQYGPDDKAAAQEYLIRSLRRFAATAQLLRSDAGLDAAIDALREARAHLPRSEPGLPIAVSGDLAHVLVVEQLRAEEAELASGSNRPKAVVEMRLTPARVEKVLAAGGSDRIALDQEAGTLTRWSEASSADTVTPFSALSASEIVTGTLVDGWLLARDGDGAFRLVDPGGAVTPLPDAQLAALGPNGAVAQLNSNGVLLTGDPMNPRSHSLPEARNSQPYAWLGWLPDGKSVDIVYADLTLLNVPLDGTAQATPREAVGYSTSPASGITVARTAGGQLVVVTDTDVCFTRVPLNEKGLECGPHDLGVLFGRMVAPGPVPVGADAAALLMPDVPPGDSTSAASATLVVLDAGVVPAEHASLRSSLALREMKVRLEPEWAQAFLVGTDAGAAELRLQILTPTMGARLRSLRLEPGLAQEASWEEPKFAGQARLLNGGREALVIDRATGRLRHPGVDPDPADPAFGDVVEAIRGATLLVLSRDASGELERIELHGAGGPRLIYEVAPGDPSLRAVRASAHDHGIALPHSAFIDETGKLLLVDTATGDFKTGELLGIEPDDVRAVLEFGENPKSLIVLADSGTGLAALSLTGSSVGPDAILSPTELAAIRDGTATLDVFSSGDRAVLRLMTEGDRGRIVAIQTSGPSGTLAVSSEPFDAAEMLTSLGDALARRTGVGQPIAGFIDAVGPSVLLPFNTCLMSSALPGSADGTPSILPAALPGSLFAVRRADFAVVGGADDMRIFSAAPAGQAPPACP